ncbi:MAG: hypothetical protein OEQ47_16115, partial [Acidimicrobiia bacterium]|nr:hypothetical protein [Acidimicrobiia bacterium]
MSHLLVALLAPADGRAVAELRRRGHDVDELRARAEAKLPPAPRRSAHGSRRWASDEAVQVTAGFMEVLDRASASAGAAGDDEVDEIGLLNAILDLDSTVADVETALDLDTSVVPQRPRTLEKLADYGRILTDEARAGLLDPVIGREPQLER